jgi:hypothetical protein
LHAASSRGFPDWLVAPRGLLSAARSGELVVDQRTRSNQRGDIRPLAIAPILIVASFVVVTISSSVVMVGPFDRAQIGWGVGVPLFLLAPGAAALAGRQAGGRPASLSIGAIGVALGVLTIVGLVALKPLIGCAPTGNALEILAHAIPVGIAAGLGFAGPAAAAWFVRQRGFFVALAVGAVLAFGAIFATILVWAWSFVVGVSCAYVPS